MKKHVLLFSLLLVFFLDVKAQLPFQLEFVANGFSGPVDMTHAGDDRRFIVQQAGLIRILNSDNSINPTPFLDIDARVGSGGERGLLGLAFDPAYADNGYFFVNYTNNGGNTVIARFSVSENDPDVADPNSELVILTVTQPFSNHNAGDLAFGPDGYLYFGLGDGGSGGDPGNRSQNRLELLGKMIRIDVSNATKQQPYQIPETNPFAMDDFTLDEIWAIGLRNPWRMSFDRETGDLWVADVGQDDWEEVNFQAADSQGGENYGWRCYEGFDTYNTSGCEPASAYTDPLTVYAHQTSGFCTGSITGGFVYRGQEFPVFNGYYFYADYCTGRIYAVKRNPDGSTIEETLMDGPNNQYTTFGEDSNGALYIAEGGNGAIYKLTVDCEALNLAVEITDNGDNLEATEGFESYQWYRDGVIIDGATDNVLETPEPGNYTVEVTDENGCSATSEAFVVISSTGYLPGVSNLLISPNPFKESILLQFEAEKMLRIQVQIYDVNGKLLIEDRISPHGSFSKTYQLNQLPDGAYLLTLKAGDQSITKKLLKGG